jgi:4-alpha-glucanotransferase
VPGYRVLRWERAWNSEGQPFIPPAAFPAVSVAATSTHDIEPLALWWELLDARERMEMTKVLELPPRLTAAFDAGVRDALLAQAYGAGSDLLLLPVQDAFGWRDRVNTPATVGNQNWAWKMPIGVDALLTDPVSSERAEALRALAAESGR